ncbi:MAG: M20/M25/M40 family metallo-hydrolase [Candidatus Margulisiibacteriota bacterium]
MVSKQRLVETFIDLVEIDSESGDEAEIREVLKAKLIALGLATKVDQKGNLIATLTGRRNSARILLSAHMDTVRPGKGVIPVIKKTHIVSKGSTILGADDKSGIAIILECLALLRERSTPFPNLHIIFSVEEEIGCKGSQAMKNIPADLGFVLDTGGPIGTVITSAPSHEKFIARIIGRAAHAGIEPEKGLHAIQIASHVIAKLKLGRIDDETVANIGLIHGGKATNIVPDEAVFEGEVRSRSERKLLGQIRRIQKTIERECAKRGGKVDIHFTREYNRFDISGQTQLLSICKQAADACHLTLKLQPTGGGSDANFFNALGIPTAVISTGMTNVHTTKETIAISDMMDATRFLMSLIEAVL